MNDGTDDIMPSVWQSSSRGLYDNQIYDPKDPKTLEYNWRGRFHTDDQGRYDLYCLRPTGYSIPNEYTSVSLHR
jgi:catechol 1,2-dioxygenase